MEGQALVFVLETGLDGAQELARHLQQARIGGILVGSREHFSRMPERRRAVWPLLLADARAACDFIESDTVDTGEMPDLILIANDEAMGWANQRLGHFRPYFLPPEAHPERSRAAVETLIRRGLKQRRIRASGVMFGVAQVLARDWDQVVLVLLYGAAREKMTLTRLSLDSGINMSTLRRVITRLEQRDLVSVANASDDRRVREITLSPAGRQALEADLIKG